MTKLEQGSFNFDQKGQQKKGLILMYPAAESKAKVVYKKPLFIDEDYSFMTAVIQEALCGCKILQLHEHEANCEWYLKNTSSCRRLWLSLSV